MLAAKELAIIISELPLKLVIKGPAKLLVTCKDMPNKAEKMKNNAIRLRLKRRKAFNPIVSANDLLSLLTNLHSGNVKQ